MKHVTYLILAMTLFCSVARAGEYEFVRTDQHVDKNQYGVTGVSRGLYFKRGTDRVGKCLGRIDYTNSDGVMNHFAVCQMISVGSALKANDLRVVSAFSSNSVLNNMYPPEAYWQLDSATGDLQFCAYVGESYSFKCVTAELK